MAKNSQSKVTASVSFDGAYSITVQGRVINSFDKSFKTKTGGDFHTRKYSVQVTDPDQLAAQLAGNRAYLAPISGGLRFTRATFVKADVAEAYGRVGRAYAASHPGTLFTPPVELKQRDKPATYELDLGVMPFAAMNETVVRAGGLVTVKVNIANPAVPRLKEGTLVQLESVAVDCFFRKPAVQQTASATKESEDEDEAVLGDSADLMDPQDGGIFSASLSAKVIAERESDYSNLPYEAKPDSMVNIVAQPLLDMVATPFAIFSLPLEEDRTIPDDALDAPEKTALLFAAPAPGGIDDSTGELTGPTDPATYQMGKDLMARQLMPIHVKVTQMQVAPTADVALHQALSAKYPESAVGDDGNTCHMASRFIKGKIWTVQTLDAGIADLASWKDTNADARIPAIVTARVKGVKGDTITIDAVSVVWKTKTYVQARGVPVPLEFAKLLLGNGDEAASPNTTWGMYKNYSTATTVTNTGNEKRGMIDLLNATESRVPFKNYIYPGSEWQAFVLLVPNRADLLTRKEERRAAFLADIQRGRGCKTPTDGQAFIEEFVRTRLPDTELTEVGYNTRDVRVSVWFLKPDELLCDRKLLETPYWTTQLKTTAAKRKVDVLNEEDKTNQQTDGGQNQNASTPPAATSLKRTFEAGLDKNGSHDMDIEGDENAKEPAIKKARKE
jgi:hypothetical protein